MVVRTLFAVLFLVAGALHFLFSRLYLKIMPPLLPAPLILIYLSGAAEIAGGAGLLIPATRRAAAWGLVALLIAVLPANIYMAVAHVPMPGIMGQSWAQWLRIPLQLPLIYWAWLYTRPSFSAS
ncbi:MAG: DoxX family protein [Acidobacteriota bacterium]|nr:DoxX family protein [Acidobacteriota bacterium]